MRTTSAFGPLHPQRTRHREIGRARADPGVQPILVTKAQASSQDGVGEIQQGLSLDGSIHKTLSPGATWRTARQRCYAPFLFGAEILGIANVCIDLGYEGKAGSVCTLAFDLRDPILLAHPGGNINPFDKHYFRGRVTAKAYGFSTAAEILAAGYACL